MKGEKKLYVLHGIESIGRIYHHLYLEEKLLLHVNSCIDWQINSIFSDWFSPILGTV